MNAYRKQTLTVEVAGSLMGQHDAESALRGKTLLIVGATGFLGVPLVEELAALGARLFAISRSPPLADRRNVVWLRGDVADRAYVEEVFSTLSPSIVFHLTSSSQGGRELPALLDTVRDDFLATINVLYAAATAKVERFVMTGSLEEPREAEPVPVSPYAAAKWAIGGYGRMFRMVYGLDVRIVRPMMTFGPGQKPFKLVPSTISLLMSNKQVTINSGPRLVDWVYRDDVVRGLILAACVPSLSETVDLGTGRLTSVADMALEIARQLGKVSLVKFGSATRGEEVVYRADIDSARRLLGFEATTKLPVGIARSIAHYSKSCPLREDA